MIDILKKEAAGAVIKVIGGRCAINHLIEQNIPGVEFIAMETDSLALSLSKASTRLHIGDTTPQDLRAGVQPSVGKPSAGDDREQIKSAIRGADLIFIAVAIEGDTGTIVAKIARELGILTVAVVAKPLAEEGNHVWYADENIKALYEQVDSLITLPETVNAFNVELQRAITGIVQAIKVPGLINIDIADLCTIMSKSGMAVTGSAIASGQDRAKLAAEKVVANLLLEDKDISGALGMLVTITSSSGLKLKELDIVLKCVASAAKKATAIVGSVFDEKMGNELRVTLLATGLGAPLECY